MTDPDPRAELRQTIADALWDGNPPESTGYRMTRWTLATAAADAVLDATAAAGWVHRSQLERCDLCADYYRNLLHLSRLVDWVRQYRMECEAPAGARDPMLRASVRQSMFDTAEALADDLGALGDTKGEDQ